MTEDWLSPIRSLLEAPSPAVMTTSREDGTTYMSPVWFRWQDDAFEVVVAKRDVKAGHLERDPTCAIMVFESVPPFRGVEVRGRADLSEGDVTSIRAAIAGRYLGRVQGKTFASMRSDEPALLVRLRAEHPRVWDLARIISP